MARPAVSRNMIQICITYMALMYCGYIDIVNYHIYLTIGLSNNVRNVQDVAADDCVENLVGEHY